MTKKICIMMPVFLDSNDYYMLDSKWGTNCLHILALISSFITQNDNIYLTELWMSSKSEYAKGSMLVMMISINILRIKQLLVTPNTNM